MPSTDNLGLPYPLEGDAATVPADLKDPLVILDGIVQAIIDRVDARDQYVVTHSGDGSWLITNGLGEPVPIHDAGDGTYSIGA